MQALYIIMFCIFFFFFYYFMSKCSEMSKALKMNITTKAGKLKSTDQFDSRRGQNLKIQF